MTMPPMPEQKRNTRVVAIRVVAFCGAVVLGVWLTARLGLVQFGSPSLVIEKVWYTNGDVYFDLKNTGWGTAHNLEWSAGPGQFLGIQKHPNLMPGGTFHMSLYSASKRDVHYVIIRYDEGKDTFIIPWSNRDSSDPETLTNIHPEASPPSLTSFWDEWSWMIQ